MKRKILQELIDWKNKDNRAPLLLDVYKRQVFNGVTPLTQHEDICVFSHFAPAEKQPRNFPSILSYPVAKDGLGRWRAKPLDLCQKLICNYSEFDGRVLDNCMGEGIVGKAALRMGRQFVGIEKDVQKFRKACKEVHSCLLYTSTPCGCVN